MDEKNTSTEYIDIEETGYQRSENLSSDEYAREIEQTRQEIDDTLHTLEDRLSPGEIWNRTINEWGGGVKEFSRNFGAAVRDNPVPATLVGIGLVWLMASGSGQPAVHSAAYESRKSRMREKYAGLKSRMEEGVDTVRDKVKGAGDMVRTASDKVMDAGHRVKDMSEDVRHGGEYMRAQGHDIKEKLQAGGSDLAGHPVLLAAVGLAIGSLLAVALPMSRREKEMIGPAGEEMLGKAEEFGREQLERGREVAAAGIEAAREKIESEQKMKWEEEKKSEEEEEKTDPVLPVSV